jgi:hypothetical protein
MKMLGYLHRHTKLEITFLMLTVVMMFGCIALATWANTDLSAGRFALFMDERITFDGVRHILHPVSIKDFLLSIVHGGDHRYGRSLWNSIALFSFVPEQIWGESGQIIADRMAQVFILSTAFFLLTITFAKHWAMRLLLLATLLAMPYSEYFMAMPKPEPQQIFFLAAFFFFFKKNNMHLLGRYWILLGLAFGTKISTLPLVIIIIAAVLLNNRVPGQFKRVASEMTGAFGYFLLGLVIAVPILLPHLLLSFILYKLINNYFVKKNNIWQWTEWIVISSLVIFNIIASALLALKFKLKIPLAIWIKSTFLNTAHGSDSASINFVSWLDFLFKDWLIAPVALSGVLSIVSGLLCLQFAYSHFKKTSQFSIPVIVLLAGLALNMSIFFGAHRLWGHYLFPGTLLMIVGLLSIAELGVSYASINGSISHFNRKFAYNLSVLTILMIGMFTFIWWTPHAYSKFKENASRTATVEYQKQYQSYLEINAFLDQEFRKKNKKLTVAFDPWLFIPSSNSQYEITEFWGPFTQWQEKPDVIVMSDRRREGQNYPAGSPEYRDFMIEQEGINGHIESVDHSCIESSCYKISLKLPIGGEILILSDKTPRN